MATGRLKKAVNTLAAIAAVLIWVFALIWFAQVAQDAAALSQLQNGILVVSVIGIAVLLLLIIGNLAQLIRDYRHHVPGVRLKARMVTLLVVLTVVPLLVVYTFSLQFINRGIDSWFSLEVEEGLESALELSRGALDVQMRENLASARQMAQQPRPAQQPLDLQGGCCDVCDCSGGGCCCCRRRCCYCCCPQRVRQIVWISFIQKISTGPL